MFLFCPSGIPSSRVPSLPISKFRSCNPMPERPKNCVFRNLSPLGIIDTGANIVVPPRLERRSPPPKLICYVDDLVYAHQGRYYSPCQSTDFSRVLSSVRKVVKVPNPKLSSFQKHYQLLSLIYGFDPVPEGKTPTDLYRRAPRKGSIYGRIVYNLFRHPAPVPSSRIVSQVELRRRFLKGLGPPAP